jgi:hypothetical protein
MADWNDLTAMPTLVGGVGGASSSSSRQHSTIQPWNRSMASLQIASQASLEQGSSTIPPSTGTAFGGGTSWRFGTAGTAAAGMGTTASSAEAATKPPHHKMSAQDAVSQHQQSILSQVMLLPDQSIQEETN